MTEECNLYGMTINYAEKSSAFQVDTFVELGEKLWFDQPEVRNSQRICTAILIQTSQEYSMFVWNYQAVEKKGNLVFFCLTLTSSL